MMNYTSFFNQSAFIGSVRIASSTDPRDTSEGKLVFYAYDNNVGLEPVVGRYWFAAIDIMDVIDKLHSVGFVDTNQGFLGNKAFGLLFVNTRIEVQP